MQFLVNSVLAPYSKEIHYSSRSSLKNIKSLKNRRNVDLHSTIKIIKENVFLKFSLLQLKVIERKKKIYMCDL